MDVSTVRKIAKTLNSILIAKLLQIFLDIEMSCFGLYSSKLQIVKNMEGCTRRSLDEEATLRENPASYRLSCITSVYEDVTVEVQGPVGAAQWTR